VGERYLDKIAETEPTDVEGFNVEEPTGDPRSFSETEWRDNMRLSEKMGRWPSFWGPRPGEEGCLVPAHLLIRPEERT
jgi:hypothetical protein